MFVWIAFGVIKGDVYMQELGCSAVIKVCFAVHDLSSMY